MAVWRPQLPCCVLGALLLAAEVCVADWVAEWVKPLHDPAVDQTDCWREEEKLTFDVCCRLARGAPAGAGQPKCWEGKFSFETCCLGEFYRRIGDGLQLVEKGEARRASDELFRLHVLYVTGTLYERFSYNAFEKASARLRKELDVAPKSLSYSEVLFNGHGITCDQERGPDGSLLASGPYDDWLRCCPSSFWTHTSCFAIWEMMAVALGPGRHRHALEAKDKYFGNMSEMWAFHHFSPSILGSEHAPADFFGIPGGATERINKDVAKIFKSQSEPMTGIVWGEYVNSDVTEFVSEKFTFGAWALTLLVDYLRRSGIRTVDLFEIGAGYGSLPRFMARARRPLLAASPSVLVRNYAVMDIRSAIDLQRWYLNKTAGEVLRQTDWSDPEHPCLTEACWQPGAAADLWSLDRHDPTSVAQQEAPLNVDFVDTTRNNLFAHHFAATHAGEEGDSSMARVLIAINSWHEFSMQDFMWHYNTFVAAPRHRTGVDVILYVSNRAWYGNDVKERLFAEPPRHVQFKVEFEECNEVTCVRLFRRVLGV